MNVDCRKCELLRSTCSNCKQDQRLDRLAAMDAAMGDPRP